MNLIWHYAPWARLSQIAQSRELKASNVGSPTLKPLLWFSARQDWEPAASKLVADANGTTHRMSFAEQRRRFGCIRFGIARDDARLLNWMAACQQAGANFTQRRKLESEARRMGANPAEWYAIAESIALIGLRFQVYVNEWSDADMSEMQRAWLMMRAESPGPTAH